MAYTYRDEYLRSPQGQAGQQSGHYLMPMRPEIPGPVLENLLKAMEFREGRSFAGALEGISGQMQRRGMRTSGIHQQALSEMLRDATYAGEAGRSSAALDIYNAALREREIADRIRMFDVGLANQQSMANQARRGQMMGSLGSLAGTWASGGFGGDGGGGGGGGGGMWGGTVGGGAAAGEAYRGGGGGGAGYFGGGGGYGGRRAQYGGIVNMGIRD